MSVLEGDIEDISPDIALDIPRFAPEIRIVCFAALASGLEVLRKEHRREKHPGRTGFHHSRTL